MSCGLWCFLSLLKDSYTVVRIFTSTLKVLSLFGFLTLSLNGEMCIWEVVPDALGQSIFLQQNYDRDTLFPGFHLKQFSGSYSIKKKLNN